MVVNKEAAAAAASGGGGVAPLVRAFLDAGGCPPADKFKRNEEEEEGGAAVPFPFAFVVFMAKLNPSIDQSINRSVKRFQNIK